MPEKTTFYKPREKFICVANTGPLISAFQCKRVDLLQEIFLEIHIPRLVLKELKDHGWGDEIKGIIDLRFVRVHELTKKECDRAYGIAERIADSGKAKEKNPEYHLGEAHAIVLMENLEYADFLLLDEEAAREIAINLGLPVTGFAGTLLRCALDRIITPEDVEDLLKLCRANGSYYNDSFINNIILWVKEKLKNEKEGT
ncbi:MAG: hypothetical protein A7316_10765 [Candidatus Altiarchaeales archaeon WOR_SM1_86-2]|nr:MAG: hypothetical protein A7316_10765 [Candidatus Altiarchaeales archaeon WOR_SM1_86-2]ODS35582.1 MAG: hypothetical protein A7315_14615 [Candidatus Altiarchaeales archaeon WOR_SM1_79]